MSKFQIIALSCVTIWSLAMWAGYFEKKSIPVVMIETVDGEAVTVPQSEFAEITDKFWAWEAQGRLNLIDALLDDDMLTTARQNWAHDKADLDKKASHIVEIQLKSYGMDKALSPPKIEFIQLRGDANGLYMPASATLYLNSKMQWDDLPFERFVEVVLHENMHHIMTQGIVAFTEDDPLHSDFKALVNAAFFHDSSGMAQDSREIFQVNPQELVTYRTQRAARYAGIMAGGLSTWEMSARMQEIRVLTTNAGF